MIPARTISDFYVRVKTCEKKQGFISQLYLCEGVYLGNAIVSNNNNKAYMKIFNTNTQPKKLTIPIVELLDFKEVSIQKETINQTDKKSDLEDRKEVNFSQQIFDYLISQVP